MMHALVLAAVTVSNAWSRPASDEGVVYATMDNRGSRDDAVVGVSTPVARSARFHESMSGASGMPPGVESMRPLARIVVRAHSSLALAPGGYHVMLDLNRPLRARQTYPITFRFEHGPNVTAKVYVRQP